MLTYHLLNFSIDYFDEAGVREPAGVDESSSTQYNENFQYGDSSEFSRENQSMEHQNTFEPSSVSTKVFCIAGTTMYTDEFLSHSRPHTLEVGSPSSCSPTSKVTSPF